MSKLPPPDNLRAGIKNTPLSMTIDPRAGWFGYMTTNERGKWIPVVEWEHCRDIMQSVQDHYLHIKGMWYCIGKRATAENVCAFIEKVEDILNLNQRTFFRRTPYPNILWLKPSPFWVNDFVRRSFFTLCLRCSMKYNRKKDNFDYCMYEHYQISRETKPAIKRFLKGYTYYTHDDPYYIIQGWKWIFSYDIGDPVDGVDLEEMLVKG